MASSLLQSNGNRLVVLRNVATVQASPDYAAGDLLGGKQTLSNVVEKAGDAAIVTGARLICEAGIAGADVDVVLFNADPTNTTFTENSALAIHDDDMSKVIDVISLATQVDFGSNPNHLSKPAADPRIPFVLSSTSLYVALVARGALNLAAADDIELRLAIERLTP